MIHDLNVADDVQANIIESMLRVYYVPVLKKFKDTDGYGYFFWKNLI